MVHKPTLGVVGDVAGGELITPLRKLPSLLSSTGIGKTQSKSIYIEINPTIQIDNSGGELSSTDMAESVLEEIEERLTSKIKQVID